jgi:hypothetical protein
MEKERLSDRKLDFKLPGVLPPASTLDDLLWQLNNKPRTFNTEVKVRGVWSDSCLPDTPLGRADNKIKKNYYEATNNIQLISAIGLLSPENKKSWDDLGATLTEFVKANYNLSDKIKKNNSEKNKNNGVTDETLIVLTAAENLLISKIHTNKHDFAKAHEFLEEYLPAENYGRLSFCVSAQTKIEGFSVEDVFKVEEISKKSEKTVKPGKKYVVKMGNISLPDYYRFITGACLAKNKGDLKKYAEIAIENNPILKKSSSETEQRDNYAKAEQIVDSCCSQIVVFSSLTPKTFNSFPIPSSGKNEEDIVGVARNIVEQNYKMMDKLANLVMSPDPKSQDFVDLRKIVTQYLDEKTEEEKIIALEKLGIDSTDAQINTYRQIQELLLTPLDDETFTFYTKLANSIEEIAEKHSDPIVLTINDAPSFFPDGNIPLEIKPAPEIENIQKSIRQFYGKHTKSVYKLQPQEIPIDYLKAPKNIYASFLRNNSHDIFAITYIFGDNEKDRSFLFNFVFDLNADGDGLDWQFIEATDDLKMKNMRSIILHSVPAILANVQKQISAERNPVGEKNGNNLSPKNGSAKILEEKYIPREKFEKRTFPKPLTPTQKTLLNGNNDEATKDKNVIRKRIIVNCPRPKFIPKDRWRGLMKRINDNPETVMPEWLTDVEINGHKIYKWVPGGSIRFIMVKENSREAGVSQEDCYKTVAVLKRGDKYEELKNLSF